MKKVFQAVPVKKHLALTYDGYVNHEETRSAEELKAEIEAINGVEYEMVEMYLVDSNPVKIDY